MLVGIPQFERVSFPVDKIRRKEITIINVRRQNRSTEQRWTLSPKAKQKSILWLLTVSNSNRHKDAFDLVADYRDNVIKAMIEL